MSPDQFSFPTGLRLVARPARPFKSVSKETAYEGRKTSCQTQAKFEGSFYATKGLITQEAPHQDVQVNWSRRRGRGLAPRRSFSGR
jgi:hypothetical protein